MLWNAKNGLLVLDGKFMDYISFGSGERALVLIPGLSDGLKTVSGTAPGMAMTYRELAEECSVYMFSRIRDLPEGYTTRQMAEDLAEAMKRLEIRDAYVIGVSQGGMIAQYLAIDHPELVSRMVLTVTASRPNELIQETMDRWLTFARAEDYSSLLIDTMEKSYTEVYLKKIRKVYPLLTRLWEGKDFKRFIIQVDSILTHNAYEELDQIYCPTLVVGGELDQILGKHASEEIARKLPEGRLHIYRDFGHGLYDEAKDWIPRVRYFGKSGT